MPEKIVTVARFSVPTEAALAKNKLEAEGIAAYLEGEFSSGILAGMVDGGGGIKLHVAESNVERAREILDGFEDEDDDDDLDHEDPQDGPSETSITTTPGQQVPVKQKRSRREALPSSDITTQPSKCYECGTPIGPTATACPSCGTALSEKRYMSEASFAAELHDEEDQEPGSVRWTPDELAARAFKAAVIGFFFPLVLFYSVWLLVKLAATEGEVRVCEIIQRRSSCKAFLPMMRV